MSRTTQIMDVWLKGTEYTLRDVKAGEDGITVVIAGKGTPPSIEDLKGEIPGRKSGTGPIEIQIVPIDIKHVEWSDKN